MSKRPNALVPAAALMTLALSGCMATMPAPAPAPLAWETVGVSALRNAHGAVVGDAQVRRRGDEWQLAIGISGQEPGPHGIHLHQVGACQAPDFASAKGHLNPAGKQHGAENPAGMHMGDMPNLENAAAGSSSTVIPLAAGNDPETLFDADGTAIVDHAGPDDYRTDPAGNSGARIACGVLSRP
jgi:Cu-Zn family superoxide dismutase